MASSPRETRQSASLYRNGLEPFTDELSAHESAIFLSITGKIFSCPRRYGFGSADEAAEIFIRYKKRLNSIIKRSETLVGNKEAYIDSCLRYLAKSIQRSFRKKELVEYVLESTQDMGGIVATQTEGRSEPFPQTGPEARNFIGNIAPACFLSRMNADQKRLLYLAIKCAWEMDDGMAEMAAGRLGLPIVWLCAILHRARASLEQDRLRLARIQERINASWLRLRLIEAELRGENLRQERREKILRSAGFCKRRYDALCAKKAKYRLLVSNRVIAELLHLPKGSIDSGLFYLKQNLREKLEEKQG